MQGTQVEQAPATLSCSHLLSVHKETNGADDVLAVS